VPGGVLVTGGDGFVGSRLVRALRGDGVAVSAPVLELTDAASVRAAVGSGGFRAVVHLAGLSSVPACEADPARANDVNAAGTGRLVDAILERSPGARMIFASTAQVYETPGARGDVRIDESFPIAPWNAYARSKREAEEVLRRAARERGLDVVVLRLFNHTHRSQSPEFFLPRLFQVLSAAPRGSEIEVPVGDLEVRRDIGALPDLIAAIRSIVDPALAGAEPPAAAARSRDEPCAVFNVCSGAAKRLADLAEGLAERLGVRARFVTDKSRLRPGEPRVVVGSHERLTAATGWRPRCVTAEALLESFLAGD